MAFWTDIRSVILWHGLPNSGETYCVQGRGEHVLAANQSLVTIFDCRGYDCWRRADRESGTGSARTLGVIGC